MLICTVMKSKVELWAVASHYFSNFRERTHLVTWRTKCPTDRTFLRLNQIYSVRVLKTWTVGHNCFIWTVKWPKFHFWGSGPSHSAQERKIFDKAIQNLDRSVEYGELLYILRNLTCRQWLILLFDVSLGYFHLYYHGKVQSWAFICPILELDSSNDLKYKMSYR